MLEEERRVPRRPIETQPVMPSDIMLRHAQGVSRYIARRRGPRRPRRGARLPAAVLAAVLACCASVPPAAAQSPEPPSEPGSRQALVHIRVEGDGNYYRGREPLSFGVPLARGVIEDVSELRCWLEAEGRALPVQARSLSRWPDGSVRWALVDTRADLPVRSATRLVVGRDPEQALDPVPWRLLDGTDGTGAGRKPPEPDTSLGGPDADGEPPLVITDGRTSWPVLAVQGGSDRVLGMQVRLVDRFGHVYLGIVDRASPRVLESGPLRCVVELRGAHRSPDGTGLPIDFHTFTARLHLLAGIGLARVEWTLENGPLHDPPGALAFRSYELVLDTGPAPHLVDLPSLLDRVDAAFELRQDGASPGHGRRTVDGVTRVAPDARDLWAGVSWDGGGRFVHREDSARNHPAALAHDRGGPLRIGLLPATADEEFWLDDATQKTFRLTLGRDLGEAGREAMIRATVAPHVVFDPRDVAVSGAWGDTGHVLVLSPGQTSAAIERPRTIPTGWADWGEWYTRKTTVSGSPRNRLSVFLEAMQSGRREPYDMALARARHAMDLRPYHIRGFSADEYPKANLHQGVPHPNEPPEIRLGRTGIEQRFPEYKAGLPAKGHGYNGFDPEHMTLDDVYECYLLTGDWVALDALRSAGEAMLTWRYVMPGGNLFSSRIVGWTLRALVQVHRATGDGRYLDAAADMVARANRERGFGPVKFLRKLGPDPRRLPDKQSEAPWMVAVAMHGLAAYWYETQDPVVPPMLRDLSSFVMSAWRGDGFVGYLPVDAPWSGGKEVQPLGTSQWIPGALGVAAFITGDHGPVDAIYPFYRQMHALTRNSPVHFGASDWHWWQGYLVSLQRRHGEAAVRGPARFVPPASGAR
jgi:hypothetical protein